MERSNPGVDRLRAWLRERGDLHASLAAYDRPEALAAVLAPLAASAGIEISGEALAAAIALPQRAAPVEQWPPPGWLPAAIADDADGATIRWLHAGAAAFDAPFYEEAIAPARYCPFNRLIDWRTRLDALAATMPGAAAKPAGLIFHLSRCGSTLTARMIGACGSVAAFSEPDPIDRVVDRGDPAMLAAMVTALARSRPDRTQLVIKLDSWHLAALPLFSRAFPDTPWVVLYREPAGILASHGRRPGSHMVKAASAPGLSPLNAYADRLGELIDGAINGLSGTPNGIAIDYATLPGAVADRILPLFGITPSDADRAAMAAIAGRDAKAPEARFDPAAMAQPDDAITAAAATLEPRMARLRGFDRAA